MRVAEVRDDSRQVARGDLFIAVPGAVVDGRKFLADAVGRGAAALVVEGEPPAELADSFAGAVAVVPNARHALGAIARNRFRRRLVARAVRGDRHQRQDDDYVYRRVDAAGGGAVGGRRRDGFVPRSRCARGRAAGAEHDARGALVA